jgi:hypothetical protein
MFESHRKEKAAPGSEHGLITRERSTAVFTEAAQGASDMRLAGEYRSGCGAGKWMGFRRRWYRNAAFLELPGE